MKVLINIFILVLCCSCNSQSQDIIVYKKGEVVPELIINNNLKPSGDYFVSLFEKAFGDKMINAVKPSNTRIYIKLELFKKDKGNNYFSVTADYKSITIKGATPEDINNGIRYFFRQYAGVYYISGKGIVTSESKLITVPHDLSYIQTNAFEYREPYFPDNYDVEFRKWYGTQTMEDTWAMWGHNLSKAVKPSAQMFARVNGKVNEEQFCFSSPELEQALTLYIKTKTVDEPQLSKYMLLANDNEIVCLCDRCKALGNTHDNASPAVFTLLNKMAKKFPKQQFFSSAYVTTWHPPKFKLAYNAGIMISTMAFPKGVVIGSSNKKAMIDKTFSDWKKVTGNVYLWDYAINFDNYYKAYPTTLIAQANLKYYKKQGVNGIFMQGSEDQYSSFADLKSYLYALLMQNPDIDVKAEIKTFFKLKYPSVADLLINYYLKIEQRSFDKKVPLDIYGGMQQSKKKYFDESEFDTFYNAIIKKSENLDNDELKDLKPLLLSLTFIKLELLRTNGIGVNGYKPKPGTPIDQGVDTLFRRLLELSSQTGIKTYNETGALISDYIEAWNTEIIKKEYNNLLFGKNIKMISVPDEEYTNAAMLTDGAIGFNDYYNNWMLCTQDALSVEIAASEVKGAKTIEMDFLQDIKHNIYPPQKVEVIIEGRKYEASVAFEEEATEVSKIHVFIPIDSKLSDKTIHIKTIKASKHIKKSIACDEIFFKK